MNIAIKFVDISSPDYLDRKTKAIPQIAKERLKEINAYQNEEVRELAFAAEIAFIECLNELNLNPNSIEISKTIYGKPFIVNNPNIQFSKSHSGNIGCCLMSNICNGNEAGCGLDIEIIADFANKAGVSKRFFSTEIREQYESSPSNFHFLEIWTSLEAISKADGRGVSIIPTIHSIPKELTKNELFDSLGNHYVYSSFVGTMDC